MKDILKDVPRWALIMFILLTVPVVGYTFTQHLSVDTAQSEDIKNLANTVANLTVVVEYNYKETERNTAKMESNAELLQETQMRLERIMGRIEARLDEEDN